jgi:hypothetical protein
MSLDIRMHEYDPPLSDPQKTEITTKIKYKHQLIPY